MLPFSRFVVLFCWFLLVGVCCCLLGFFLWIFDAVFGLPLYFITVVVTRLIDDVVRCFVLKVIWQGSRVSLFGLLL